jgi:hypothetical protein
VILPLDLWVKFSRILGFAIFGLPTFLLISLSCSNPGVVNHAIPETRIDGGQDEYPNPFSPTTNFAWVVPDTCQVTISIFNVIGQAIDTLVNEVQTPGRHSKAWDPVGVPTGVYFSKCTICGKSTTKKLFVLK